MSTIGNAARTSAEQGYKADRAGRIAQNNVAAALTTAGCIVTRPEEDRFGWDLLVEYPATATPGVPADLVPAAPKVLVQVKASQSRKPGAVQISLSALEPLIKTELPVVFVFPTDPAGRFSPSKFLRIASIDAELMERALKQLRHSHVTSTALNKLRLTIGLANQSSVEPTMPEALADAIRERVRRQEALHGPVKLTHLTKLGYSERPFEVAIRVHGNDDIRRHFDAYLGLEVDFQAEVTSVSDNRFDVPVSFRSEPETGRMKISDLVGRPIVLEVADSTHRLDGTIHTLPFHGAEVSIPDESRSWLAAFRFSSSHLSLAYRPWDPNQIQASFNFSQGKVRLQEAAEVASFWLRISDTVGRKVGPVALRGNGHPLVQFPPLQAVSAEHVLALRAIEDAGFVARAAGISYGYEVDPRTLVPQAKELQELVRFLGHGSEFEFEFGGASLSSSKPGARDLAVLPVLRECSIGEYRIVALFLLIAAARHERSQSGDLVLCGRNARPSIERIWTLRDGVAMPTAAMRLFAKQLHEKYRQRPEFHFIVPPDEPYTTLFGHTSSTSTEPSSDGGEQGEQGTEVVEAT